MRSGSTFTSTFLLGIVCVVLVLATTSPLVAQTSGTVTYHGSTKAASSGSVNSLRIPDINDSPNVYTVPPETGTDIYRCGNQAMVVMVSILNPATGPYLPAPSVNTVTWTVGTTSQSFTMDAAASGTSSSAEQYRKSVETWFLVDPTNGNGYVTVSFATSPSNVTAEIAGGLVLACGVHQTFPLLGKNAGNVDIADKAPHASPTTAANALLLDIVAVESGIDLDASPRTENWDLTTTNLASGSSWEYSTSSDDDEPYWDLDTNSLWAMGAVTLRPFIFTAIELADFDAFEHEDGVHLRWHTGREVDTIGYHLYRDDGVSRERIDPGLIAGSALTYNGLRLEAGYSYGWRDHQGTSRSTYWLEEVSTAGERAMHGPFQVKPGKGVAVEKNSALLRDVTVIARAGVHGDTPPDTPKTLSAAGHRLSPTSNQGIQWQLAARDDAVKVGVIETGWHRITEQQLAAAGVNTSTTQPDRLQLFVDGRQQAIQVIGGGDGSFDPGDAVEFYGQAVDTLYDSGRVYWLVEGNGPGRRVSVQDESTIKDADLVAYRSSVERHDRLFYAFGIINGEQENFFGEIVLDEPVDLVLPASEVVIDSVHDAVLTLALQGFTDVEHAIAVEFNGNALGSVRFNGAGWTREPFDVPASWLINGDNRITLTPDPTAPGTLSLVDYAQLAYTRLSVAIDDSVEVGIPVAQLRDPLRIGGFSSPDIRVIDVSDPQYPVEVIGKAGGRGFSHSILVRAAEPVVEVLDEHVLLALTEKNVITPEIELNTPSAWNSTGNSADMIIVTHSDFAAALAPLVALHQAEGLEIAVVDVGDVYDEFGYGMKSPQALRRFLSLAKASWQTSPRYLLLVGDASYDPKNYLGFSEDFIPTKLVDSGYLETASDDWFVDFNSGIAIGRLPVSSAQEAAVVIDKIVTAGAEIAADSSYFLADEAVGENFEQVNIGLVERMPPGMAVGEVAVDEVGVAAARITLLDAFNDGVPLIHFSGHGTVDGLHNGLLTAGDADGLGASGLVTLMSCLTGMYHEPLLEGLGEALVNRANTGPAAVLSSTGITLATEQTALMEAFYSALFGGGATTIGEAAEAAKAAAGENARETWVLIGDPAMKVGE